MLNWFQTNAATLVVAFGTAYLSVQLALQRFYREKWWERRLNAYLNVIDSLHTMKRVSSEWYNEELEYMVIDSGRQSENSLAYSKASAEFRKMLDLSDLMLSSDASKTLENCKDRLDAVSDCPNPLDRYDEISTATQEALDRMRVLTKCDLALERRSRWLRVWRAN